METSEKRISVIVPVYNIEKYIAMCLESVIRQTYGKLEIILVDDGSTDASGRICDEYARKDDRICVIHKKNGGLSDARNAGLDRMTGDYVCFIDGDDFVHRRMCEILLQNILKYDASISACDFERVDAECGALCEREIGKEEISVYDRDAAMINIYKVYSISCSKLYHKRLFETLRYPVGKYHEDEFMIHKLIYLSRKIVVSDAKLYFYVQREGSITARPSDKKLMDALEAYEDRISFARENQWIAVQESVLEIFSEYIMSRYYGDTAPKQKNMLRGRLRRIIRENNTVKIKTQYRLFAANMICYRVYLHILRALS